MSATTIAELILAASSKILPWLELNNERSKDVATYLEDAAKRLAEYGERIKAGEFREKATSFTTMVRYDLDMSLNNLSWVLDGFASDEATEGLIRSFREAKVTDGELIGTISELTDAQPHLSDEEISDIATKIFRASGELSAAARAMRARGKLK